MHRSKHSSALEEYFSVSLRVFETQQQVMLLCRPVVGIFTAYFWPIFWAEP